MYSRLLVSLGAETAEAGKRNQEKFRENDIRTKIQRICLMSQSSHHHRVFHIGRLHSSCSSTEAFALDVGSNWGCSERQPENLDFIWILPFISCGTRQSDPSSVGLGYNNRVRGCIALPSFCGVEPKVLCLLQSEQLLWPHCPVWLCPTALLRTGNGLSELCLVREWTGWTLQWCCSHRTMTLDIELEL